MQKKLTSTTAAGLIISILLIVIGLVVYFASLYTETWAQYLGFVVLFGGLIWAVLNNSKERDHKATFGNLFGFGFKTTAVIIVVMVIYTLISGYIFPDVKEKLMETARENALKQPGANESQIEQGMALFEKNFTLFVVIGLVFWYAVLGAVASLIGAAVAKKKPVTDTFDNV